jgi:hypothetical protein
VTILVFYVDDLFITRDNISKINLLKKQLEFKFKMINLGRFKIYMGIEFFRMEKGIFMFQ